MKLNNKQIKRQDFVDNEIFELLQSLNPTEKQLDWDIEIISQIRESVQSVFVDNKNFCTEQEFYPFIEE